MAIDYDVLIADAPLPLDDYAVDAAPAGCESAGVFIGAMLTSDSGRRYQGCRGYDVMTPGRSTLYPFNRLDLGSLASHAPLWRPGVHKPGASEAYATSQDGHAHVQTTPTSVFRAEADRWTWRDFDGGWDLTVRRLGRPYTIVIPRQGDFASGQKHRCELGFAQGTVDGEPVAGLTYLMHAARDAGSGVNFVDLPLMKRINAAWYVWMVELEDGTILAGEGRDGRPGTGWRMSYLVEDGAPRLAAEPKINLAHAPNGPVQAFELDLDGLTLSARADACSVWPHVVYGDVAALGDGRRIRRSWSNLEWYPDNYDAVVAGLLSRRITAQMMLGATVEGRVLIPGVLE